MHTLQYAPRATCSTIPKPLQAWSTLMTLYHLTRGRPVFEASKLVSFEANSYSVDNSKQTINGHAHYLLV